MPRRPFLLLTSRVDDLLAGQEYEGLLRITGLRSAEVTHVRMEQGPFLPLDLEAYSGVILGGSPFTVSDEQSGKTDTQVRVEAELVRMVRDIVADDVPYLGLCYGIGVTSLALGGIVDRTYGEPVGAAVVRVTPDGRQDPIFAALPESFEAFVGHKEACSVLPDGAVLLATNADCPVHAYRLGTRQYVTQFHPELEVATFVQRIRAYATFGYFDPADTEALIERVSAVDVSPAHDVLRGFVRRFGDGQSAVS